MDENSLRGFEAHIHNILVESLGVQAARKINVTFDGSCISLFGLVDCLEQKDEAENLVRGLAGVSAVQNYISVNFF